MLGILTLVQGVLLAVIGTAFAQGPEHAVALGSPKLELTVMVVAAGLAAMSLGLLVSALVTNADRALSILPLILLVMYLLSGGPSDPHNRLVMGEVSYVNSVKWGFSGVASTSDLLALNKCVDGKTADVRAALANPALDPSEQIPPREQDDRCKALWAPTRGHWMLDLAALGVLFVVELAGAGAILLSRERRHGLAG